MTGNTSDDRQPVLEDEHTRAEEAYVEHQQVLRALAGPQSLNVVPLFTLEWQERLTPSGRMGRYMVVTYHEALERGRDA